LAWLHYTRVSLRIELPIIVCWLACVNCYSISLDSRASSVLRARSVPGLEFTNMMHLYVIVSPPLYKLSTCSIKTHRHALKLQTSHQSHILKLHFNLQIYTSIPNPQQQTTSQWPNVSKKARRTLTLRTTPVSFPGLLSSGCLILSPYSCLTYLSSFPPRLNTNQLKEDERTIANKLASAEKAEQESDAPKSKQAAQIAEDATLPAKSHGNEPSRGAKIDQELREEEEAELKRKGKA
jgi:hypothetical protein